MFPMPSTSTSVPSATLRLRSPFLIVLIEGNTCNELEMCTVAPESIHQVLEEKSAKKDSSTNETTSLPFFWSHSLNPAQCFCICLGDLQNLQTKPVGALFWTLSLGAIFLADLNFFLPCLLLPDSCWFLPSPKPTKLTMSFIFSAFCLSSSSTQ